MVWATASEMGSIKNDNKIRCGRLIVTLRSSDTRRASRLDAHQYISTARQTERQSYAAAGGATLISKLNPARVSMANSVSTLKRLIFPP